MTTVTLSVGGDYVEADKIPKGERAMSISGTQVREDYLAHGRPLPEWFTRPEVAKILAGNRGICVWLTGLSGAGKSTIAEALAARFLERGQRVTLLDGDAVRATLSKGLGFSAEDKATHIERVAYVAAEVSRHGGIAICAVISPYRDGRARAREMVEAAGGHFIEIYVNTPVKVCEDRDTKGLWARARRGELPGFAGVNSPYEEPITPWLIIDTSRETPDVCVAAILRVMGE